MTQDIQVFSSIYQNEDTRAEYFADVAVCLSAVDCINENNWPDWTNQEPKTDICLKSGLSVTVMADFKSVLSLWQKFRETNHINNLLMKCN